MKLATRFFSENLVDRPSATETRRLTPILATLPALWPTEPEACAELESTLNCARPDTNRSGCGYLLGWNHSHAEMSANGELLACDVGEQQRDGLGRPSFSEEVSASLKLAHQLVRKHATGAFRPMPASADTCSVSRLTSSSKTRLDGKSFGLAFVLAIASSWLERPLGATLVATGELTGDGRIDPVDGLAAKVLAALELMEDTPLQLMVSTDQDTAPIDELVSAGRLRLLRVATVSEALLAAELSPDSVDDWFATRDWHTVVSELHGLAFFDGNRYDHWAPFLAAARWATANRPVDSTNTQALELALGAEIVLRHCQQTPDHPVRIPLSSIASQVPSVRGLMLAHFMQAARDTGTPEPEECARVVEEYLPEGLTDFFEPSAMCAEPGYDIIERALAWSHQLFNAQLRTAGAYLRWRASDATHWAACAALNYALAEAWKSNHGSPLDIGYPVSELLRLLTLNPDDALIHALLKRAEPFLDTRNPFQYVSLFWLRPNPQGSSLKYLERLRDHAHLFARGARTIVNSRPQAAWGEFDPRDVYLAHYNHFVLDLPDIPPILELSLADANTSPADIDTLLHAVARADAEVVRIARAKHPDDARAQAAYVARWFAY